MFSIFRRRHLGFSFTFCESTMMATRQRRLNYGYLFLYVCMCIFVWVHTIFIHKKLKTSKCPGVANACIANFILHALRHHKMLYAKAHSPRNGECITWAHRTAHFSNIFDFVQHFIVPALAIASKCSKLTVSIVPHARTHMNRQFEFNPKQFQTL